MLGEQRQQSLREADYQQQLQLLARQNAQRASEGASTTTQESEEAQSQTAGDQTTTVDALIDYQLQLDLLARQQAHARRLEEGRSGSSDSADQKDRSGLIVRVDSSEAGTDSQ